MAGHRASLKMGAGIDMRGHEYAWAFVKNAPSETPYIVFKAPPTWSSGSPKVVARLSDREAAEDFCVMMDQLDNKECS